MKYDKQKVVKKKKLHPRWNCGKYLTDLSKAMLKS